MVGVQQQAGRTGGDVATGSSAPPAELDPRRWLQTGAEVIEHGLPELPPQLTYQMSIPMCCWAAECCAEVTFMRFLRHPEDGHMAAMTTTVPYARQDGRWVPPRGNQYHLSSYAFDPVTDPDDDRHLDGSAMTYGRFRVGDSHEPGHPASSAVGHVSPAVKYLAVIQGGHQDYRPLQSHFGAWAVCVEKPGSFDVAAFGSDGKLLQCLEHPSPLHRLRRPPRTNT